MPTAQFTNYQEVIDFIENLERETVTRYVTQKISNKEHFGLHQDEITSLTGHKILWKDCQETVGPSIAFDGVPYINIGYMVKECHQGPDRQKNAKRRKKHREMSGDHNYSNRRKPRKHVQLSKKTTCPATIRIRVILKFPEFKVDSYENAWMKRKMSRSLKQTFANKEHTQKDIVYFLSYPENEEHKNHITGELAGFNQSMDSRLIEKIKELVVDGVRHVKEMKRHLTIAVQKDICPNEDIPLTNRRYYPRDKDIKNHMDITLNNLRFSRDDQSNLEELVQNWQESNPQDHFFLRSSYGLTDKQPAEEFLFVHQTAWQRRLLRLYGSNICIMDATYRTSKYALPLFFICVPTNVGHSIIGSFLVSSESKVSIMEGLRKLQQWNPDWSPSAFITDFDEREIQAIEEVFSDCFVYLCAFHREQAWSRWLKQIKNGVGSYQEEILELMRKIANSHDETSYKESVDDLKVHPHWLTNGKLQSWFQKKWLSVSKRWVRAFRNQTIHTLVTTTNALERKHQEFKRGYLTQSSEGSLSAMVTALVTKFLPESYRSYLHNNVQGSELCRTYSTGIPDFLHNKPRMFVEHCLKRIPPHVNRIPPGNITCMGEKRYSVLSVDSGNEYAVTITDEQPTCSCVDYNRHNLPCKHLLAVLSEVPGCSWNDLPEGYRSSPYFNLDTNIFMQFNVEHPESTSHETNEQHLSCSQSPDDIHLSEESEHPTTLHEARANTESSSRPVHIILNEAISGLKEIQSDVYLVNDASDLEDICGKVFELRSYISSKLPKDCGIKLAATKPKKRPSLKRKPKDLPLNKKYKLSKKKHVRFAEEDDVVVLDGIFDTPSCDSEKCDLSDDHNTDLEISPQVLEGIRLDVDTLWAGKPVGYLVGKVGPHKITDHSIAFLKTTLSDEVSDVAQRPLVQFLQLIDAYLHLLKETKKNKKIFHITSSIATAIFEGGSENFHGYMSKVKFSDFDLILGAVNENNSHWTLVVIYPSQKRLLYINPLGELKKTLANIGEKWRKFIFGRMALGLSDMSSDGWKIETTKHTKQTDSNSCGVYVVKFAELIISDMALSFCCRQDSLSHIRRGIGNQLLQATEPLEEICRACSLHKSARGNDGWVKCSQCDKFFHGHCIDPVGEDFICLMCTQQTFEYDLRINPTKKRKRSSFLYTDIRGRYPTADKKCSEVDEKRNDIEGKNGNVDEDELEEIKTVNVSGIDTDFINTNVDSLLQALRATINCDILECDERDHERHHQFMKNPLEIYNRYIKLYCFGEKYIDSLELELIQDILRDKMTCSKAVHGSIFTKYRTLQGLQNEVLSNIFLNYPLMAAHYLSLVLLKEAVVFLVCLKTGMPYEEANERCSSTERAVKELSL